MLSHRVPSSSMGLLLRALCIVTLSATAACGSSGEDDPVFCGGDDQPACDGDSSIGDTNESDVAPDTSPEDVDATEDAAPDTEDDGSQSDVTPDAPVDVEQDVSIDTTDAGEDADAEEDVIPDVNEDVDVDADATTDVEPDAAPDAEPDAGPEEGELDGPCYPNLTCNLGLLCVDGLCSDEGRGDEGGPCYPNLTCNEGHVCVGDRCELLPAECDDGTLNGEETDSDCGGPDCVSCEAGLACALATDCLSFVCEDAVCLAPECGDGVRNQESEECDDGNASNADGCRRDCTIPVCGDGIVDANELCDGGDNCSRTCALTLMNDSWDSRTTPEFEAIVDEDEIAASCFSLPRRVSANLSAVQVMLGGGVALTGRFDVGVYTVEDGEPSRELFLREGETLTGLFSRDLTTIALREALEVSEVFCVGIRLPDGGFPTVGQDADGFSSGTANWVFGEIRSRFAEWVPAAEAGASGDFIIRPILVAR